VLGKKGWPDVMRQAEALASQHEESGMTQV
jgi:hypothetical protein